MEGHRKVPAILMYSYVPNLLAGSDCLFLVPSFGAAFLDARTRLRPMTITERSKQAKIQLNATIIQVLPLYLEPVVHHRSAAEKIIQRETARQQDKTRSVNAMSASDVQKFILK